MPFGEAFRPRYSSRSRVICCVRNPAGVVDSINRLIRRNAFEPSGIFNYEPGGTVYSRVEGLSKGDGRGGPNWGTRFTARRSGAVWLTLEEQTT